MALVYSLLFNLFLEVTCRTSTSSMSYENIDIPITFFASANSFSRSETFFLVSFAEGMMDAILVERNPTSHITSSRDGRLALETESLASSGMKLEGKRFNAFNEFTQEKR